jgi:hypothetical protein
LSNCFGKFRSPFIHSWLFTPLQQSFRKNRKLTFFDNCDELVAVLLLGAGCVLLLDLVGKLAGLRYRHIRLRCRVDHLIYLAVAFLAQNAVQTLVADLANSFLAHVLFDLL